jgi:hypothetical protein
MRRHIRAAAIGSLLVLPLGGMAAAAVIPPGTNGPGLASVGPVSATDGFPVWYKDKTGMRLTNCVALADPLCPARGPLPDETAPISFPDNYPDEGFYLLADSVVDSGGGGVARAVIAVEQAFSTGPVVDGDQVTFARVRYRITKVPQNGVDYKVTSPAGTKTLQADGGLIFDTDDIGIGAPGDFSGALGGRVGPFLTWDTFPNDPALAPDPVTGKDTYIGDGATAHAIKGSPYGTNFFRVEGPGINPNPAVDACPDVAGAFADCLQTDLFSIQGKLATTNGVTAERATYSRSSAGAGLIDVFATSEADTPQSIQVTDANADPNAREFGATGLPGASDHYSARVAYTGANPPAKVQVSNIGDVPVTNKLINVVDGVTGTATYDTSGKLTINAVSSDTAEPRTLTAVGFGPLDGAGSLVVDGLAAAPPVVTVTSDAGGQVDLPVQVTGPAGAPLPVVAMAGPDQNVATGSSVTLDGTASTGDIRSFSWTSPAGVSLANPNTATPTFTAPGTAGDLLFVLTVTGPNGATDTADVTVHVSAAATPVVSIAAVPATQRGKTVTLDGSASTGAGTYSWSQTGGPNVTLSGGTTAKATFTVPLYKFPASTDPFTFSLTVTNNAGSDTKSVTVTPTVDTVDITAARYTPSKSQWRIDGSSSVLAGQTVTAHLGGLAGPTIGSAVVDATGAYSIRNNPGFAGVPNQTVSVESQLGGTRTGFTIRVG